MICLDTAPVIWGVQGRANQSQTAMIDRTRKYLAYLEKNGESVMIPAPVVAEYLIGFAPENQEPQAEVLERRFLIPAFDIRAARVAAELHKKALLKAIKDQHGIDRQSLRVDTFVLAIAIVHGAERLVTNDIGHMTKLAQGKMTVIEVPDIPHQPDLFQPPS